MRKPTSPSTLLTVLLSSAILSACGGGGGSAPAVTPAAPVAPAAPAPLAPPTVAAPVEAAPVAVVAFTTAAMPDAEKPADIPVEVPITAATTTSTITAAPPKTVAPPKTIAPSTTVQTGAVITDVIFQNTSTTAQTNVPVTFGHVFAIGHVSSTQGISGQLADGSAVPLQADIKARHADGSVRHAIISVQLPQLAGSASSTMKLLASEASSVATPVTPMDLLNAGFSSNVHIDLAGVRYSASADQLLRSGSYKTWLSGAVNNEWMVSAPLKTAAGAAHPHLTARFAIRAATASQRARVDVTIENNWAYEIAPQNFTYDAQVEVGGQTVFTKAAMTHYHHARWRKVFWWGAQPQVHIKHNVTYLIATKAVPNYDRSIAFTETKLNAWKSAWTGTKVEPMGVGIVNPYMPATGGRDELGQMPAWSATYLLTMDKRVKDVTLGTGDLGGSWSTHYRDRVTDRPVSLMSFPYMTILGKSTDTMNPVTRKYEAFPVCATSTACTTPYTHDTSHQASFAYLPYLVTGDYYYLEELQFWGMYNAFSGNPAYREQTKALVKSDQVRGQAWSLRSMGEAAYITPDDDSLKSHFASFVKTNLDWYDANYTNNPSATTLGVLTHGYAVGYDSGTGIAPWQDDFFTASIGRLAELGFSQAQPLLAWKSQFAVNRMTDAGVCWVTGSIYSLKVRDSATAAFYPSMAQAWKSSHTAAFAALPCGGSEMAVSLKLKVGEMTGYSAVHSGYPSNMQPALAYAADALGAPGAAAWTVFMNRSVKPNYGLGPQFAIVPR